MNALIASFCIVFLKAMQQQHVIHRHFYWAAVTSYGLAVCEVAVLLIVIDKGWPAVPWIGTGGAMGVTLAMWTHGKMRGNSGA